VKRNQQNNMLYEVITSYESQESILSYHNILDFWSVKNLHHNPYHMIMDSLYLLKSLIEWLVEVGLRVQNIIWNFRAPRDHKHFHNKFFFLLPSFDNPVATNTFTINFFSCYIPFTTLELLWQSLITLTIKGIQ